jgi:septum formation protein
MRRPDLLAHIGIRCVLRPVDVSGAQHAGESPQGDVQRLALEKAQAGWRPSKHSLPVLSADTMVQLNGRMFGKPADEAPGLPILKALSGREHRAFPGVAIGAADRQRRCVSCTRVRFRNIGSDRNMGSHEFHRYWASGEPLSKAGAYAIQGRAAISVADSRGSYSGTVGLPLFKASRAGVRQFLCGR